MNYYEHHLGDYAEATSHLSLLEDAVYSRLIRKYYSTEKPLPADKKIIQRLVGARTKEEKEAVDSVLEEFFMLEVDGWHNTRCDKEIYRYREGDAERKQRVSNENERMRRHRDERSSLFEELRKHGVVPKWDTPVTKLREILQRTCNAPATRTGTEQELTCNEPATACNAPATANHTPDTKHQTPDTHTEPPEVDPDSAGAHACGHDPTDVGHDPPAGQQKKTSEIPTKAGAICRAIRENGIADANPSHPKLSALIDAGADVGEFVDAARLSASKGSGFAYVLGVVEGRRKEASRTANGIHRGEIPLSKAQSREKWNNELNEVLSDGNG